MQIKGGAHQGSRKMGPQNCTRHLREADHICSRAPNPRVRVPEATAPPSTAWPAATRSGALMANGPSLSLAIRGRSLEVIGSAFNTHTGNLDSQAWHSADKFSWLGAMAFLLGLMMEGHCRKWATSCISSPQKALGSSGLLYTLVNLSGS